MSTYLAIARTSAQVILEAPSRFWGELVYTGAELGMLLLFWSAIAAGSNGGIDAGTMVAYFLLSVGITNLTLYRQLMFTSYVKGRVKGGSLSAVLLRPIADLPALYTEFAGTRASTVVIGLIITVVGVTLTAPTLTGALLFLPAVVGAWAIGFSLSVMVAGIGLRIIETTSLRWIFSFGIRLATGAVVPLAFYPQAIQDVLRWTPFPALVSTPIRALNTPMLTPEIALELTVALVWAVIVWVVARLVWNGNLRHYDAVGL